MAARNRARACESVRLHNHSCNISVVYSHVPELRLRLYIYLLPVRVNQRAPAQITAAILVSYTVMYVNCVQCLRIYILLIDPAKIIYSVTPTLFSYRVRYFTVNMNDGECRKSVHESSPVTCTQKG